MKEFKPIERYPTLEEIHKMYIDFITNIGRYIESFFR